MKAESYTQNLSSIKAWEMLSSDKFATLIDVRTLAEWAFVGIPDLSKINKKLFQIDWQIFPSMTINPNFKKIILEEFSSFDIPLLFICRVGGRSHAAMLEAINFGYKNCYNIENGFEGDLDQNGHRSNINGWKFNNLPWRQT